MKQVDADGLEIITVNGGELKAPQGGGVDSGGRPSMVPFWVSLVNALVPVSRQLSLWKTGASLQPRGS